MRPGPRQLRRVAYLGPPGTFTEEALRTQADLARLEGVATATIADAIALASTGEVDAALVPIENSIEGIVNVTLDSLIFGAELFIQREVVLDIHLALLARKGVALGDIRRVISFPQATAQCRSFLAAHVPGALVEATNSTADAARQVAQGALGDTAAVAPRLAGEIYGLEVLAHPIEDHEENQTRFVLVAADELPPPSGHDRTMVVCFQHADRPGSLHEILGVFAARNVNLTMIESRPTKRALGDYCFVIEVEGHLGDHLLGDCLIELHTHLKDLRVLGSYPVAGAAAERRRAEVTAAQEDALGWLADLRARVNPVA